MKKRKIYELGASMTVHSFFYTVIFIYLFKTTSLVLAFCCREIIINSKFKFKVYPTASWIPNYKTVAQLLAQV